MVRQLAEQQVERVRTAIRDFSSGNVQISRCTIKVDVRKGQVYLNVMCEMIWPNCDIDRMIEWIAGESGYGEVEAKVDANGEVVGGRVTVSYDLRAFKP